MNGIFKAGVPKSGQRGEVQDLMAKAFVGSNPTSCTTVKVRFLHQIHLNKRLKRARTIRILEWRGKKMARAFIIRKYQPEDREQCRILWKELTEWHREIYEDPNIGGEHPEDHFDKHLAEVGLERLWVAVHDSKVVGLGGLIVKDREAEIEPLIVSKAYRHKGIGKHLTRTIVSEARKLDLRFLTVKPVARNIEAIKFFYQQGFKTLGQIELCLDFCQYAWKLGPKLFALQFDF